MILEDFIRGARALRGAHAVLVEEHDGVTCVTTFVVTRTEALSRSIYALETKAFDAHPNLTFDFHIQEADPSTSAWQKFAKEYAGEVHHV